ncbi:alpha/beta fold hydrolase [Pseudonocardia sp. KRD291]|uniref:alpha/beta fold hydrolase n=1 Tax=Pseudonocardia sp. KRD291 TaxID=2792007 RepID=UPI001C49EB3F|nr:alpha/beta hydrolase [Pseudonocardia sp. KRD291]MBW0103669.1 alpha/beta hydrolase [Pseudonocardia sp. KRD291]
MSARFFDGFTDERIDVGDAELRVRHGGSGPAVLLLHGHPRTGATWHRVAPQLVAAGHTVICPDLRGYGASSKPATTADHAPYSKRAMAADMCALVRKLGHERVLVAGHDRGSYVAFRMALDAPDLVERLAVLDSVPISEALDRCDTRFATAWWHWFFFAQPDTPERVILADPDAWYRGSAEAMGDEAFADYRRAIHDPATVRAMLEDYRAGLGIDRRHEDADRAAGNRLRCPLLVLWSSHDDMEYLYGDPLSVWRPWATDVTGGPITSGHHMAEEAPDQLAAALGDFFGAHP